MEKHGPAFQRAVKLCDRKALHTRAHVPCPECVNEVSREDVTAARAEMKERCALAVASVIIGRVRGEDHAKYIAAIEALGVEGDGNG